MPSFYIPLSGLEANSNALSVTANNLANLNTIGYKTQRPLFQDLFYQQVGTSGDGNPEQIGVGASIQGIDSEFTQGSIQASGVDRKSTRLNSSHITPSRMPSSA